MKLPPVALRVSLFALLWLSILLWPSGAVAVPQSLRSEADVRELVISAMDAFVANDIKAGYRALARHSNIGSAALAERLLEGERVRSGARKRLGISIGWESVDEVAAGTRLLRIRCLERFERGALGWHFVFYRADQVWTLESVVPSDDLGALF